jgi:hypothetical protein
MTDTTNTTMDRCHQSVVDETRRDKDDTNEIREKPTGDKKSPKDEEETNEKHITYIYIYTPTSVWASL